MAGLYNLPELDNVSSNVILGEIRDWHGTVIAKPDIRNRTMADVSHGFGTLEGAAIAFILSLFILLALAGNSLVIVAILTDRHLRKTSNFFIVSLAVADALVALLVMTFSVVNDILERWIFGSQLCNIWMSCDVMCSTASIMNLCAISLDRYIHIRNPLHYSMWVTQSRTLMAIALVWILSALISFLPIQLGWHRLQQQEEALDGDDDVFICTLELNPLYALLSSTISFFLPCLVMILIYVKLYNYARMHVKMIRQNEQMMHKISTNYGTTTTAAAAAAGGGGGANHLSASSTVEAVDAKSRLSEHKASVTLGIIMGVFLVCWTPFFTANVVSACCHSCIPSLFFSISTWLGYMNSTMNPIIYSIFNKEFQRAFKRVLSTIAPFHTLQCCGCRGCRNSDPRRDPELISGANSTVCGIKSNLGRHGSLEGSGICWGGRTRLTPSPRIITTGVQNGVLKLDVRSNGMAVETHYGVSPDLALESQAVFV